MASGDRVADCRRWILIIGGDSRHGRTSIDLGNGPVQLALPTLRFWAEASITWEEQAAAITADGVMVYEATGDLATVGGLEWEDSPHWASVVELNRHILTNLGAPLPTDDRHDLALGDRMLTAALLTHWRDHPLSPWDPDRVPRPDDRSSKDRKIIRSNIRGVRGAMSVIYRALYRHDPATLDGLQLWQVASLLGRDDPDSGEDDPLYAGARTTWTKAGNRETLSWGRHPRQRLLFSNPAQITLPRDQRSATRPMHFR